MRSTTRKEAKADVFDYIERFYNAKRAHRALRITIALVAALIIKKKTSITM